MVLVLSMTYCCNTSNSNGTGILSMAYCCNTSNSNGTGTEYVKPIAAIPLIVMVQVLSMAYCCNTSNSNGTGTEYGLLLQYL
jgi:hypothetical protein